MDWQIDIYKEYKEKIYGFILSHVKCQEVAEDLTHDVFVKLYSKYTEEDLNNSSSVIWTITRNSIVDHHRKVAHSKKYMHYLWDYMQDENSVAQNIEYEETRKLFRLALKKLTPQQWRIYNMIREDNLSYIEISQELNISTNTVRNHMVAALKIIRNFLMSHQEFQLLIFILLFV